jgi:hypothetical protein
MRAYMLCVKIIFCFFIFTICRTAYADICIEEKITTTISGKTFQGIKKTYITKSKILVEDPTISKKVIYDYENNKVYLIDNIKKDISIYALNNFSLPSNEKIYPDFAAVKPEDMLSKESGSKKKIGKYSCYEVVIYIPKIATLTRVWLTKDILTPLNPLFLFLENNNDILLKKLLSVMKESNAYVVESVTTIVRPKESEKYLKMELVKISEEVPDTIFTLPQDYRILNMDVAPLPDQNNSTEK